MKKKLLATLLVAGMTASLFAGCGNKETDAPADTQKPQQSEQSSENNDKTDEQQAPAVTAEALPDAFAHYTFDGGDEGYTALIQVDKAADSANDGANFDLAPVDAAFGYADGPVDKCIYLNGKYGLDLHLEPTNTDAYTVSFWLNADRFADYGPTLQVGYDMGKASDAGNNVTWMNFTKTGWGADSASIFPVVWSRNEASDAADGTDCWPWMYAFDNSIHGKKEWVMVTVVASGEQQAGPGGATTTGAQFYLNGELKYDSQANYTNATYFEYTWDATLAPNIMKPDGKTFESYLGINYWDTIYKGFIDDLYVYDSALTPGQVLSLYQLGDASVKSEAPEIPAIEEPEQSAATTGYKEYAVVRADNFGWGSGYKNEDDEMIASLECDWNWDTFKTDMQDANVTVTVKNNTTTADVLCEVVTADGTTYHQNYNGIAIDGDLFFCLGVEAASLELEDGSTVGAADCSTGWWQEFSEIWSVPAGESVSKKFVNHTSGIENWHNFIVVLQNVFAGHSQAEYEAASVTYKEYAVVRADNFGWGSGYKNEDDEMIASLECDWNWDTFKTDMEGANVTVTVKNNTTSADILCEVVTADGTTYHQNYNGIAIDGNLFFCLGVEAAYLELEDGATVGAADCSTGWWQEFSEIWSVPAGESVSKKFVNHTSGLENWHNFIVVLQNVAEGHAA